MAKKDKKVRIFSALEVANICGVVNQTAINWIKNGYLKAFTTPGGQYRVYSEDLIDFLSSRGMRIPDELQEFIDSNEMVKREVLIVDDDEALNNMLKQFIGKWFAEVPVHQAFDGFEAGRVLSEKKPGLIILDIDLPGINGHQLCQKIKADGALGSPSIISVTGLDDPAEEDAMLEEGADAFLKKPLDFDKLHEIMRKLLSL